MQQLPTLYDHQIAFKDKVRFALTRNRAVIIQAEPGVGKTRLAKWIMGNTLNRIPNEFQTGNSLFAVHRRGLVDNASDSFTEDPRLQHGVVMSGRDTDWSKQVQVASIDTMLSWYVEGEEYKTDHTFDLVCFDETHSHVSKLIAWLKAHDQKRVKLKLNPTFVIGLSATPDAKGLADLFGEIITGPKTEWLIDKGFLSPFRYFQATQGQLGLLVKRGNEFTKDSVSEAMKGLSGDLVRDWKQFGTGRPTVGFFSRRTHARDAMEVLNENDVNAEYVDGNTPDEDRRRMFHHLNEGRIDYLCNVGIVERGTNIPRIGCVQLCTAIGSVVRYRQMIGRGSRTHEFKDDCIVIDHGGNIQRHGFFEDSINWILDNSRSTAKEHNPTPTIKCPRCSRVYRGGKCANCEYEPSKSERKSQGLEFDGAELKEVVRKPRKESTTAKSMEQLIISALFMVRRRGGTWKSAYAVACREAEKQGEKFKCPKSFEVAGKTYWPPQWNDPNCNRRVTALFPFLN